MKFEKISIYIYLDINFGILSHQYKKKIVVWKPLALKQLQKLSEYKNKCHKKYHVFSFSKRILKKGAAK